MKKLGLIIKLLAVAVIAVTMEACSSHRSVSTPSTPATPQTVNKRVKALDVPQVAALAETYTDWETFYAPFSFRATHPMSLSVSGRATMVRDSYINLSLRMLGFEVATIYVDSDSAFVADKYHKLLVVESLDRITARTGLTVGDIQDILMGRAFYPGRGTLCSIEFPESMFSPSTDGDYTVLTPRRIPSGASWFFTIDEYPALRSITVEPDGYSPFVAEYADICLSFPGALASEVTVTGNVAGKEIEALCQWNLDKARWNEPVTEPSLGFKGYRRLSASEFIKAFKQL